MRYLLIVLSVLLTSYSKDAPVKEPDGITFHAPGQCLYFSQADVKVEAYGDEMLYSISSSTNSSDKLLISIVAPTLCPGVYHAGLNYWGSWMFSGNINFRVISFVNGKLTAVFDGSETSGQCVNVQLKKPV